MERVLFDHIRYDFPIKQRFTTHPKGGNLITGATICYILDFDNKMAYAGWAYCSEKDQFCRRMGRMVAENRARNTRIKEYLSFNINDSIWEGKINMNRLRKQVEGLLP